MEEASGGPHNAAAGSLTETTPQTEQRTQQKDPKPTTGILRSAQNDGVRNDASLMSRIRDRWGARIVWACAGTAIPAAVIAALIANESAGNPSASNLERTILAKFENALNGRPIGWQPLSRRQLETLTDGQRIDYATSWGLTQITGYHLYPRDPRELLDPDTSLRETVVLFEAWAK